MSTDQNKVLNHLIEVCEDAREFYHDAAEQAENPAIKKTFKNMETVRENIVSDLRSRVMLEGGKPDESGTVSGKTAQFFSQLKAGIANTDEALVSALEEAEDKALEEFHEAMAKNLPSDTISFLDRQEKLLRRTHDHMKELKDTLKLSA